MTTLPNWFISLWGSPERLATTILLANWGIVATLFIGCILAAFVIIAGNKRDQLLSSAEREKEVRIAAINKLAADANERAGQAAERSANLESEAEEARVEQKRLELSIQQFRHRNLRLESEVERGRIERIRLQDRVTPRTLTTEQITALPKVLGRHGPGGALSVYVFIGTDDGMAFSINLAAAINLAPGWKATHRGQTTGGGGMTGVFIFVKDTTRAPIRADALQKAFDEIGVTASAAPCSMSGIKCGDDDVILFVAPKP